MCELCPAWRLQMSSSVRLTKHSSCSHRNNQVKHQIFTFHLSLLSVFNHESLLSDRHPSSQTQTSFVFCSHVSFQIKAGCVFLISLPVFFIFMLQLLMLRGNRHQFLSIQNTESPLKKQQKEEEIKTLCDS